MEFHVPVVSILLPCQKKSLEERHKQLELARERNVAHIGLEMPGKSSLAD